MAVREIAVPWGVQPPDGTPINWGGDLASQADYIVSPLTGELSAKAGASDRFVSLSSGLLVPRSLGTSFGTSGGTSDGHSTVSNFTAISGATSLSLFVVLQCTTTTGPILGRWGTTANWGGLLLTFESNALVTVIAPSSLSPSWYAKRTGALSAGTILYGCTWYGANSQDNYINGVVNNGTTWFTGSPAAIQTASEKLYLNRNADAASGSGNSSVLFAAIGINKKWTASTHAQWAASYNEVYEPRRIWVPVSVSSGGITGTLAATETGSDTASFAGDVLVSGTLAASETGSDTAAFAGDVYLTGTLAATESGSDTAAFTGTSAVVTTGTLAATETGSDTAAFAGDVLIDGALAATESGSDTAAFAGDVLIDGTLSATESGSDTAAFTGTAAAAISGTLAASESGSDTAAFTNVTTTRDGEGGGEGRIRRGVKPKRKPKFLIEVDGKFVVVDSPEEARQVLSPKPVKKGKKAAKKAAPEPSITPVIDLGRVEDYADLIGEIEQFDAAMQSRHYQQILAMFDQMQDDEDVELLLLAL